ncbi:MAG: LLM class flavin-dependent oxidoreductase [Bacteroidia bacterium]|nr:LLM class flavin-dependent oxidoreductase [Bacteroidia bacterium]
MSNDSIQIRSKDAQGAEVSWFAPLCNGDDQFLGNHDIRYKSDWSNTSNVLLTADRLGYRNILCPSSYQVGQDTLAFASAVAPLTSNINILAAIRCGEVYPPMLGRAIATIDHILKGRLTINIISSNLPGSELDSAARYQRSREVIEILKQGWNQDYIDYQGEFYKVKLDSTDPLKPYQQNGGPLLYFGGYSPSAVELCAEHCDVYLMWPETEENLHGLMKNMSNKAAEFGRQVDFGLRVHVIVRETEAEAKDAARRLMTYVEDEKGKEIRERALDAKSYGVSRQSAMREQSDLDGFVEPNLWTGIGRARSGCGGAIVGNPEQVLEKIHRYMKMGIRAFIFSGYPHADECKLFANYVLPHIKTFSMPELQGRKPVGTPMTPLAAGPRN